MRMQLAAQRTLGAQQLKGHCRARKVPRRHAQLAKMAGRGGCGWLAEHGPRCGHAVAAIRSAVRGRRDGQMYEDQGAAEPAAHTTASLPVPQE